MCSFITINKIIDDSLIKLANRYAKYRGPDLTNVIKYQGYTFVHKLLSITGDIS